MVNHVSVVIDCNTFFSNFIESLEAIRMSGDVYHRKTHMHVFPLLSPTSHVDLVFDPAEENLICRVLFFQFSLCNNPQIH